MKPYFKTVFRSIRMTLPRFIAIFAIIALGVGFFAGLKVTTPSFVYTANKYAEDQALFDFRLLSTIGFTDEDIAELSERTGCVVEGAYSADCSAFLGDKENSSTVRFLSITQNVNKITLESGRLPQKPDEIVVDAYQIPEIEPGTKLVISEETSSDSLKLFKYREYTIVGTARSPLYMNFQRGTSNEGSGSVTFYVCALPEAFDSEYYTEAYLWANTGLYLYSDEYKEWASDNERQYKVVLENVIDDRFEVALRDEYDKLYEGIDEFNGEIDDAWSELSDARDKLDEAKKKLEDAEAELADKCTELEEGKATLDESWKQLSDYQSELATTKSNLDATSDRITKAEDELESLKSQIDSLYQEISDDKTSLSTDRFETSSQIATLEYTKSFYEDALESVNNLIAENEDRLEQASTESEKAVIQAIIDAEITTRDNYAGILDDTVNKIAELEEKVAGFDEREDAIDEKQSQYEGLINDYNVKYTAYFKDKLDYETGVKAYESSKATYDKSYSQYQSGLTQYEDAVVLIDDAQKEIDDGWKEYYDGVREYWKGYSEYSYTAGTVYRTDLEYGFEVLDSVEDPEVYILGRDTNTGYVCFDNDAKIVDGVSTVFPIFFFAIAALVCSTTMSRMVSDERGVIGTMRALGYSDFSIVMKYSIYAGSASIFGSVLGFLGGTKLFPWVIWEAYKMMYGFTSLSFTTSIPLFVLSIGVALLCTVGVTVVTCLSALRGMPAELIRPKAPIPGKRILLEYVGFIWKRMKFLYKVSARNVFRFKKRMWMMIVGIAGCTALLITAFGILDSVCQIVDTQFDNITKHDLIAVFDTKYRQYELEEAAEEARVETGIDFEYVLVKGDKAKNNGSGYVRDLDMYITDAGNTESIFGLTDHKTGEQLPWPSDGEVAISSKLAEKNNVKAGDTITLLYGDDEREVQLKVGSVFTNYTFHYALMTPNTYREAFGKAFTPETLMVSTPGNDASEAYSIASYIGEKYDLKTWSSTADSRESFANTMERMNYVIILIIVCAAALAFIVLFNLNNINITERIREIATLKVMGFNRRETGAYVTRENVILVFFGYLAGIPTGIFLHRFVMDQIAMDMVSFQIRIEPISYLYSLAFVLAFSSVVNLIMRARIEKIDMAESLKSAE